ncbi:MAG: BTAD domain-containing putative transcriptional regulator [Cyanobacteria bacterium P01_F01_bin.53]
MSDNFRINLFGELSLSFQGDPVLGVKSERLQALLSFLLLHRDTPQPRQSIAVALWPDASDANAKANLRRRLHDLKQKLPGEDWLHIEQKTVQWQSHQGFVLDVAEFQMSLTKVHSLGEQANADPQNRIDLLEQAISLYKGDLLPSCYDEWIEPHRNQLRQQATVALENLIELLAAQQQPRSAIAYAQQLRQLDPLSESGYCYLMKLHDAMGDRATALRVYHQCMAILQEELGVDPSPETRELYEAILLEKASSSPSDATSVKSYSPEASSAESSSSALEIPASDFSSHVDWGEAPNINFFHGRTAELEQLEQWLTDDRLCLIAVLGIGGVGKTALAAKLAHDRQREFDYVIWRSLRNAPPLDTLLNDLVPFLSNQQDTACSLSHLMHWLRQSRCLVILDNVETILKSGERAGQFREEYVGYGELIEVIGQANHQSCLVLTSREKTAEVSTLEGMNLAVKAMRISGSPEAALALLEAKGLEGTQEQKEQLSARYGNSPLAVQIVGGSIRDVFCGDIALFLEEDTLLFNGAKKLLDRQFSRLTSLEKTVMTWLAINREWTSIAELMADIYPRCSKRQLIEALESLSWRSLIERRANTYTQQPVIMEYVITLLLNEIVQELVTPNAFKQFEQYSKQTHKDDRLKSPYLSAYALLKTTVKDYIRDSQRRILLQPIVEELKGHSNNPQTLILEHLKAVQPVKTSGYWIGNLLNLGRLLNTDFTGLDLSQQQVRQADLQNVNLHQVNFTEAHFQQTTFNRPAGPIFNVAFNHDGSLMAVCEGGGRLVVWCMETYTPKLILKDTSNWLLSVTFNHNSTHIVSEGADHQIVVWDVATGQCVQRLSGHSADIWDLNAHPSKNLIVSASTDGTVCIWNLTTGELCHKLTGEAYTVRAAAFSPDGKRVASGAEKGALNTLNMWDVKTGALLNRWQRPASILSLSFSPDGQYLAIGYHTGEIELWNNTTETVEQTLSAHATPVMALQFSPCGRYLASGSYRANKLWEASTGKLLWTANDYGSWIWGLAFNPNASYLAVVNHDQAIRLWELPQKRLLKTLPGFSSWITAAKFHPDQHLLATCSSDGTARLWDIETGKTLAVLEEHQDWVVGVDFSPCGQYLVTSSHDQTIKLWSVETGKLLKSFVGHAGAICGIQFSPDGQRLVSSDLDLNLRIWDLATGRLLQLLEHPESAVQHGWMLAIQFSPDQQYLATGGSDASINFWDAETGQHQKRWKAHTAPIWSISFHPSSQALVPVGEDATVKIWDTSNGELLKSLDAHTDGIYAASYSPDGRWLATAGDDCAIRLWDAKTYTLTDGCQVKVTSQ